MVKNSKSALSLRTCLLLAVAMALAACTVTQPMVKGERHSNFATSPQPQPQYGKKPEEPYSEPAAPQRLLIMPADVEIYELTAGGLKELKADWTEAAQQYVDEAIKTLASQRNVELLAYRKRSGISTYAPNHLQLIKLHERVGQTIMFHTFAAKFALPTKNGAFDWSLGDAVVELRKDYGADYALFVNFRDSFASGGRVGVMIAGALLGVGIQGGRQSGFASLVDLKTGEIAWFNRLISTVGDLRDSKQALSATDSLLDRMSLPDSAQ